MARKKAAPQGDGMVRVRMTRDHDFRHAPARVTAFKAGAEASVASSVAEALVEAGVAEKLTAETED